MTYHDRNPGIPPITVLHPSPEDVQKAWVSHQEEQGYTPRFEPMIEDVPGELLADLGVMLLDEMAKRVHQFREDAADLEIQALRKRWGEIEMLETISELRQYLGLPDGPMTQEHEQSGG